MVTSGSFDIEMDNLGDPLPDPESLVLRPRSHWSFLRSPRIVSLSRCFNTSNIRNSVSVPPVNFNANWGATSNRFLSLETPTPPILDVHDDFLAELLGERIVPDSDIVQSVCRWYISFIDFKIRESWCSLFRPVLQNVNSFAETPCDQDIAAAFRLLGAIIPELRKQDFALIDIVDTVYNSDELYVKYTDEERSQANQLVFSVVGWISILYTPRVPPDEGKLQVIDPYTKYCSPTTRKAWHKPKRFTCFEQTLEHNDRPFHIVLRHFGQVIPENLRASSATDSESARGTIEDIKPALLRFDTLWKVASIKIEWVDSLSLHLEFDRSTRVVRIFRLPSFCFLMCCSKGPSLFSQLFWDSAGTTDLWLGGDIEDASTFYREVLLSYRLIFAQNTSSIREFVDLTKSCCPIPEDFFDPLLLTLCGQSWKSEETRNIYGFLGAEKLSNNFLSTDFPILGKHLLDLQRYIEDIQPENFWDGPPNPYERRNFWINKVVIVISCLTLLTTVIFGFVQVGVGALQVMYTKQQLSNSAQGGI